MADNLSVAAQSYGTASTGNYALIGGGTNYKNPLRTNTVDTYDSALVHSTAPNMDSARNAVCGVSVKGLALLMGGSTGSPVSTADIYTRELLHSTMNLSKATSSSGGTGLDGRAMIFGGSGAMAEYFEPSERNAALTIPAYCAYKFDGYHETEQIAFEAVEWESEGPLSGYIKFGGFTLSGEY